MTSLTFLSSLISLLPPDGNQTSSANFTTNSTSGSWLNFGAMQTMIRTKGMVYHLEEDLYVTGNILYSDTHALMTTDGKVADLIAGSDYGYAEGRSSQAKFFYLSGFLQTNSSHVLVVDQSNHCLRFVSRHTNITSPFVGNCTSSGLRDGQKQNSLFTVPIAAVKNINGLESVIVTEYFNKALRIVNLTTGDVMTLVRSLPGPPTGAAFDSNNENLIISLNNFMGKYNIKTSTFTSLTPTLNTGGSDGEFSEASFVYARDILRLTSTLYLVADYGTNKLRTVDVGERSVGSICTGRQRSADGPATSCSLYNPWSLLLKSGMLYIGERGAIRTISVKYLIPCKDQTFTLLSGETEKCLEVLPGHEICMPPGIFTYTPRERNCTIKINITREMTKGKCREEILRTGDPNTLKSDITLPDGTEITLPVGRYSFKKRLPDNATCETVVHVRDPRLKMRLDVSASYQLHCSLLSDFRDLISSLMKTRYSQIKQLSSGLCNQSADSGLLMTCSNSTLQVIWPTDCLFDSYSIKSLLNITMESVQKRKGLLQFDLAIPSHMPPIIRPTFNQEGHPVSVLLTPVCSGGLKYVNLTETCQ